MKSAKAYQARKQQVMNKVAEVKPAVIDTFGKAVEAVTAMKEDAVTEVFVQYGEKEAVVEEVVKKAKEAFVEAGNERTAIKSVKVYVKPEDGAAYYVINDSVNGKVELF